MRTSLWIAVTAMALSALAIASPSSYAQTPTPTPSRTSTPTATSSPEVAIPVTFLGTVSVDGASAPDGTLIQAIVNGVNCGSTTTQAGRYSAYVKAGFGTGPEFQQGCPQNGDIVSFQSAGRLANETGRFVAGAAGVRPARRRSRAGLAGHCRA